MLNGNRNLSNTEVEFRNWRFMIPNEGDLHARPLGPELSIFFQKGAELVACDAGIRQDVTSRLASPGGLARVRELVELDFSSLNDRVKFRRFLTYHIHFFQIITHPDVLSSIILEQPLGSLFTFLYGINGQRTIRLFSFITDLLSNAADDATPAGSLSMTEVFHLTFQVFAKIIDINGGAQIHPDIANLAEVFSRLLDQLVEEHGEAACEKPRASFIRIQQRLGIGQAIPNLANKPKPTVKQISFGIPIDHPGHLSSNGPRHDNDHEDIREIEVLPTWQEVKSLRPEYLPVKDPATWHKSGVQGLLDRHFRLLREDTVGQLRDAVQAELSRMEAPDTDSTNQQNGRQGLRTYTYRGVSVADFSIDRRAGLRCQISFPQPPHVRDMSASKRLEWWTQSRRLQPDALVCLLDKTGLLLFCSVAPEPSRPRGASNSAEDKSTEEGKRDLHADSDVAFLELCLVDQSDQHITDLLRRCWTFRQMSLVEFPGVLLPAFKPTLKALQQMSLTGDVPFSEFLAPGQDAAGVVRVPPPAYARRANFSFSLCSITNGSRDIRLSPQREFDATELAKSSSLDYAQARAVVDSLTQSFALIQGPPGTGKSYTGIALIKVLLDNRTAANLGPIVCVCYTNHALDQLLEHLVDAGISQIIRVGSRSKSEVLKPLLLREVAMKLERTKTEKRVFWEIGKQLERDEREIEQLITALGNADSWQSVKEYLQQNSPSQHDEIFGSSFPDEDGFMLQAEDPKDAFVRWLSGGRSLASTHHEHPSSLPLSASLLTLSHTERRLLHLHWTNLLREKIQRKLVHALHEYNDRRAKQDLNRLELNLRCLQEAHIIGITTSGLARNLDILRRVRAKVMVCEEAGEVMESHTLTAMLPSVEHAILIGDHEQLRPQIQRYDLGREHPRGEQYSLDVSLFERLVRPNDDTAIQLPYTTLETQRRMHPMISQLVRDTLYPALHDAPSTMEYPMVPGMKDRLFWFDHNQYETDSDQSRGVTSTSRTNDFEVDMTVGLVSHLMKQGIYHAEDIAVLTPYLGQLHKLRARLGAMWELVINDRDLDELEKAGIATEQVCKTTALQALKVATIDNFQGEEAKVVIISLVRSNEMNNCGFLKTSNRINVLLSRAQHGMFIIGNSKTAGSVEMWQDVLDILRAGGNIGTSFELQCPRHPLCAADKIKDQQVDFIEMLTYKEVDLDEDPCLFPPCGHIMTMANMDGHMDMNKHYVTAPDGTFVGLKPAPPFSNDELKACPTCRGALRSISRYGRVVRRALLDESTKKFIVWSQNEYLRLQTQFQDAHSELSSTADAVVVNTLTPVALTIAGSPPVLFRSIKDTAAALNLTRRYRPLFALRTRLQAHVDKVQHEEQPFRKVHDFCQDARRRRRHDEINSAFALSPEVLQTRAHLLASALLLRCDLALVADVVAVWRNKLPANLRGGGGGGGGDDCTLDLSSIRRRCQSLLHDADAAHSPAQKVEALLFHAQSNAIERLLPSSSATTTTTAAAAMQSQHLRTSALAHLATARAITAAHPGSTGGLSTETDAVERMLQESSTTFFAVVTSDERRAVLAAMAAEFSGTGHWYYCANGHPFTVGECGAPMQLAACPQCGAPAGGRGHVPAEGVTRAVDLEGELGGLRL
ncbi:hypothetical protein SLS58_004440 [Diplodia intermedia]|uniref:RZ-type domain-containing protein n=1 Tax=Diplodia intermedia TaxID=856260 RepID=A0ABR3TU86_9PEZI